MSSRLQPSNHDKLVHRLTGILIRLNQGLRLVPGDLAEEFRVTVRTIQRDIARFGYLPLKKVDGGYELEPLYLGKLTARDVERFASLAGVSGLFPSINEDFLRDIFDSRVQTAVLVKGHDYEDIRNRLHEFRQLEGAIVGHQCVGFRLQRGDSGKVYEGVEPYRLLNQKGIWYLVARHAGRTKTFSFARISGLLVSDVTFEPDSAVMTKVETEDGVWFQEDQREVVLQVNPEAAPYFRRRKLIANQVLEKELPDGGLLIITKIGHENQVIPIVRYWIPHVRIISPAVMQVNLEKQLLVYAGHPKLDISPQEDIKMRNAPIVGS